MVILLNCLAIVGSIFMGLNLGDVSFFFQERQSATFVSALQLALTSFMALFIYILGRMIYKKEPENLKLIRIWIISAAIFSFAVIDEYFMLHEGIDGDIATAFFGITENPHLDGLTLSLYGVVAIFLFFRFKEELLKHRPALSLFAIGGLFFLASITLDIKSTEQFRIVLEESAKLIAVAFIFLGHASVLIENLRKVGQGLSR
ncbi:MAG: hypothetical protein JSV93_06355 [Candidatus Omnitrophota bacterium]|nr:MAG: hypothetical protein JSV93_06355 [Candidatus Omnitrophota bacterium]